MSAEENVQPTEESVDETTEPTPEFEDDGSSLVDLVKRQRDGEAPKSEDEAGEVEQPAAEEPKSEDDPDEEILRERLEIKGQKRRIAKKKRALEALEAQLNEKSQRVAKMERLLEVFEKDPYAFVKEAGLSYKDWALRALRDEPAEDPAMAEVKKLREELDRRDREREQLELQQRTAADVARMAQYASAKFNPDMYPTIQIEIEEGRIDPQKLARDTVELIIEEYKRSGGKKSLTPEQIYSSYEQQLREESEIAARRLARLKKPTTAQTVHNPNVSGRSETPRMSEKRETATLSNRDTAASGQRPQTVEERRAAIAQKYFAD